MFMHAYASKGNFFFFLICPGSPFSQGNKKPPNKKIGGLAIFQHPQIRLEDP
jgi:hypothetical protein